MVSGYASLFKLFEVVYTPLVVVGCLNLFDHVLFFFCF